MKLISWGSKSTQDVYSSQWKHIFLFSHFLWKGVLFITLYTIIMRRIKLSVFDKTFLKPLS